MSSKLRLILITLIGLLIVIHADVDMGFYVQLGDDKRYDYYNNYIIVGQFYLYGTDEEYSNLTWTYFRNSIFTSGDIEYAFRTSGDNFPFTDELRKNFPESRAYLPFTMTMNKINSYFPYYVAYDFDISSINIVTYKLKYFTCPNEAVAFRDRINSSSVQYIISKVDSSPAVKTKPTTDAYFPNCLNYLEYGAGELLKIFYLDNTPNIPANKYPSNNSFAMMKACSFCAHQDETCYVDGDRLVHYTIGGGGSTSPTYYKWVTTSIPCTNDDFGGDPDSSNLKYCRVINQYNLCVADGLNCDVPYNTTVYYGAWLNYNSVPVTAGTYRCSPHGLGISDPNPPAGYQKNCYYLKKWVSCGVSMGGTCTFSGKKAVKYSSTIIAGTTTDYYTEATTSIGCDDTSFGLPSGTSDSATCSYY